MEELKTIAESPEHRWTESSARIEIAGLDQSLRILHLTDTHITCSSAADEPFWKYSERMDDAFAEARPIQRFDDSLVLAGESKADIIVLTGDIVNNPSATSVAAVKSRLDRTRIAYLYTAGNHDWHYEGMDGSSEELRARWRADRLSPLYTSANARKSPACYTQRFGNMVIFSLDNSTYQVDKGQLEAFRSVVDAGLPMILAMHIPVAIESMDNMLFGHPDWGAASDKNYIIERRERWPEAGNTKVTETFIHALVPRLISSVFDIGNITFIHIPCS